MSEEGAPSDLPQNRQELEAFIHERQRSDSAGVGGLPIGGICGWAIATPPERHLLCDGAAIPEEYERLLALGLTNTPDLRGKVLVGAGQGIGLTNRALNAAFGSETHPLTTAEGPTHNHSFLVFPSNNYLFALASSSTFTVDEDLTSNDSPYINNTQSSISGNTGNSGSGSPHNNIQPSLALHYIIRAA